MIDLLVAGGGPAGLATALHGARAGLEVVVVERRSGPIDKACGEGLMPHTVRHLERLGIDVRGRPFRGISYLDADRRVDAPFRSGAGCGMRRIDLHAALLKAATATGVRFVHTDIGEITQDLMSVRLGELRARYLAAADGLHSPIRRSLGLVQPCGGPRRWGIRRHVQIPPWTDYVEVHWAAGAEAYVTPVGDDCVGIAILTSRRGGFDGHLNEFPALTKRVHGRPHGPDRAAGPLRQKVRSRTDGRILLVGDAAGYVDALTGEGLGIAFGAAELLVSCIVADTPGDYDRQWRQMSRRYRLLTAALLQASTYAPLRSRIVQLRRRCPTSSPASSICWLNEARRVRIRVDGAYAPCHVCRAVLSLLRIGSAGALATDYARAVLDDLRRILTPRRPPFLGARFLAALRHLGAAARSSVAA